MHLLHFLVPFRNDMRGFRRRLNPLDDAGYAVAEFAVVLPVLIFMTAIGMWSINVCVSQLELQSTVATISRTAARGDSVIDLIDKAQAHHIAVIVSSHDSVVSVDATKQVNVPLSAVHDAVNLSASMTSSIEGGNFGQ